MSGTEKSSKTEEDNVKSRKCDYRERRPVFAMTCASAALFAVLVLSAPVAFAQGGPGGVNHQILSSIGQKIIQSMQTLTNYSYQQRTEVQVSGETKSVQLSQVAFGPEKQPLITPISSQPSGNTGRGLRGLIKRKKIKEMKEEVSGLVQLANSYLILNREKMAKLNNIAQVWVNPNNGTVRVDASNFFHPGDRLTMICNGQTKDRTQVQVQTTSSDGNPVTVIAQYQVLPTGLNYNAQTTISEAAKSIQIMINTLNYQKQ